MSQQIAPDRKWFPVYGRGIAGLLRKKINQSLTKFYQGISDIGGQKTCFFRGKGSKPPRGRPGNSADDANL